MNQYTARKRILLIDEYPVCHLGLERVLRFEADYKLAETSCTLPGALRLPGFDLTIIEIASANTGGLLAIKELRTKHPDTPILIYSRFDESLYAERCLKLGASGYLMKRAPIPETLRAIKAVANKDLFVSDHIKRLMINRLAHPGGDRKENHQRLSDRELLIVEQIGLSKSNKQIAQVLQTTIKTVESHRSRIKSKLQLETPQELIRFAMRIHCV